MSRRLPRRSRVYDCNYDKGESYYRPALERLDRKYSGRLDKPLEERAYTLTNAAKDIFKRPAFDDTEFHSSTRRARADANEAFDDAVERAFDSRGAVIAKSRRPLSVSFDTDPDFEDEVNASLRKIRINNKKITFDDEESALRPRNRFNDIEDSVDSASQSMAARKRVIKMSARSERSSDVASSSDGFAGEAKWTALRASNDEGSAAAIRAKQSRAMLADIEQDLAQAAERQAAREKRISNIRKLVADNREDDEKYERLMQRGERVRSEVISDDTKMLAY